MKTKKFRAFTLVELLVVIAIIGVLIALLLPAVQAAREAARRMSCSNKLKQLAIAVHNYHDSCQALPHATGGPYGPTASANHRWSGFVSILPFIEMNALYEQYLSTQMTETGIDWFMPHAIVAADGGVDNPMATAVTALLCPSDGNSATKPANYSAATNYRFCLGDNAAGFTSGTFRDWRNTGVRGPFGIRTYFNLSDIVDGTSNTLMMSEHCLIANGDPTRRNVKETGIQNGAANMFESQDNATMTPSLLNDRSICSAQVVNGQYVSNGMSNCGWAYMNGSYYASTFATVLPPNGASCYWNGGSTSYNVMMAATSNHPGGVQTSLMDGSCRFVSETIDSGTGLRFPAPTTMGEVSGPSPFGVWGAYGSRDGGEAASL